MQAIEQSIHLHKGEFRNGLSLLLCAPGRAHLLEGWKSPRDPGRGNH